MTASNINTTLSFVYDSLGRVKSYTDSGLNKTITYDYDRNGNRTKMTDPEGRVTNYTYTNNNLTNIGVQNGTQTMNFGFSYDELGRRKTLTYPNGITATHAFDPASNLANLQNVLNAAIVSQNTYSYDSIGNRTTNSDLIGTPSYEYDVVSSSQRRFIRTSQQRHSPIPRPETG